MSSDAEGGTQTVTDDTVTTLSSGAEAASEGGLRTYVHCWSLVDHLWLGLQHRRLWCKFQLKNISLTPDAVWCIVTNVRLRVCTYSWKYSKIFSRSILFSRAQQTQEWVYSWLDFIQKKMTMIKSNQRWCIWDEHHINSSWSMNEEPGDVYRIFRIFDVIITFIQVVQQLALCSDDSLAHWLSVLLASAV